MNLEQLAQRNKDANIVQRLDEIVALMREYNITAQQVVEHVKVYESPEEKFLRMRTRVSHYGKRVENIAIARKGKAERRAHTLSLARGGDA